jgi:AcrR family transcriptional regulator
LSTRPYKSTRREEAARATRAAILDAAERLYVERGFGQTKLTDVAAAADVSLATVKVAFGTKKALLEEVLRARLVDDTDGRPLTRRESWREMLAESRPGVLIDRFVALSTELHQRSADLIEAVAKAGAADPELAEIARRGGEKRHADMSQVIAALEALGALRPGLDAGAAADILWALMAPSLYLQLTVDRGWSPEAWAEFVTAALRSALLDPTSGR